MALPTTIVSDVGLGGHHPPFKSSGGDFYSVVRTDADELDVYKATDPTDSWTIQDSGDGPVHAGTILGFATVQDSDVIHMVVWSSDRHEYYTFNMATDQWAIDEAITDTDIQSTPPDQPWASIAVRSDGDVVVVYAGETDANMGDEKERVDVNIRTAGTWGGPVAVDAGGDIHYGNPNCVLGTNDGTHILYQFQTATTADPPTAYIFTRGRTLNSADSLSTRDTSDAFSSTALLGMQNAVSYDDSGTQRMVWAYIHSFASETRRSYQQGSEDGSDDLIIDANRIDDTAGADPFINGEVGITSIAELSGDIHQLFAGGGSAGVDQDLYYTKSTDNGDTWDTPTEEIDAITVDFISANIYTRGGATVLAYVYDDAGVQKYNEKELIAAPAGRIMSSLVRSGGLVGSGGIAGSGGGLAG